MQAFDDYIQTSTYWTQTLGFCFILTVTQKLCVLNHHLHSGIIHPFQLFDIFEFRQRLTFERWHFASHLCHAHTDIVRNMYCFFMQGNISSRIQSMRSTKISRYLVGALHILGTRVSQRLAIVGQVATRCTCIELFLAVEIARTN